MKTIKLLSLLSILSAGSAIASPLHAAINQSFELNSKGPVSVAEAASIYGTRIANFANVMSSSETSLQTKKELAASYLNYATHEIKSQTGGSGFIHDYFIGLQKDVATLIEQGKVSEAASFVIQTQQNFK